MEEVLGKSGIKDCLFDSAESEEMETTGLTKAQEDLMKVYPNLATAFLGVSQDQFELFANKMLDYGIENLKAGTNLETPEDIKFVLSGVWFRMMDKMNRWKNLQFSKNSQVGKPNCEGLLDTFRDLSIYAIIAQLIYTNKWHK